MRKIFIALLAGLSFLGLTSCDGGGETKTPAKKKTVIQYCGWDLGTESEPTLKRKMIEEFNATSEDIIIDMLPSSDPLDVFYTQLAANGSLPDVFLIDSVPTAVMKEWALDITSLTAQDTEWANVESSLKEAVTYNDKIYAIPAAQNYVGFLANYDLIDEYAYLDTDAQTEFAPGAFTTQDFFDVIPQVKNVDQNGSSVVGINAVGDMINWLPSTLNDNYEHFVWNDEAQEFDFTSQVMIDALTKIQTLGKVANKYTFNSFADATAEEDPRIGLFGSADAAAVFLAGQIGFYQGMTSDDVSNIKFNYKFVGYPDKRVVSAGDFLCISAACQNKEAAYEVAKFLSYGSAGIQARYKIVKENDKIDLTGLPVNVDPTVTSEWFNYVEMKGVKEIYDQVVAGEYKVIVEGNKTIPGFVNARFKAETGIKFDDVRGGAILTIGDLIWDVCEGAIEVGAYKNAMTQDRADLLNKEVKDADAKIKEVQAKQQ